MNCRKSSGTVPGVWRIDLSSLKYLIFLLNIIYISIHCFLIKLMFRYNNTHGNICMHCLFPGVSCDVIIQAF